MRLFKGYGKKLVQGGNEVDRMGQKAMQVVRFLNFYLQGCMVTVE